MISTRLMEQAPQIAVIGGGISGLAAAHRLIELQPSLQVSVFEAGERCGGVIATERTDGFQIELGPDSLLRALPWGVDLCRRLGIADALQDTNAQQKQTWIVRSGELHPLPEHLGIMAPSRLWPALKSPILSTAGKVRLAGECFVLRRNESSDESFAAFAQRRFGREAFERLVQPLVSGIYMADPQKLSMQAALPRFVEMESRHGSLIRAARHALRQKNQDGPRRESGAAGQSMFVAPCAGLGHLIETLQSRLPAGTIKLRSPVQSLVRTPDGRWDVSVLGGPSASEAFSGVILATPSDGAVRLLQRVHGSLSAELAAIKHSGCVVVSLAYPRDQIAHRLDGYGFVVPAIENRSIIACTFSSVKYAERAPEGHVLLRVFLGGATRPEALAVGDDCLLSIATQELTPLLGLKSQPAFAHITRWPGVMPQYHVGHLDRIARIEAQVGNLPGLELAGNSYRGVGIPHCIHSGELSAERMLAHLHRAPDPVGPQSAVPALTSQKVSPHASSRLHS